MATITGLTSARMQAIIDATITGAHITGDNLILELWNGNTINVGSVRGAQGIQGAPGEVSQAAMDTAIATSRSAIQAPGAVTTTMLAASAVTSAKLAANSVDSTKIVNGSIVGADIAAATITNNELGPSSVTNNKIADGVVGTGKLADNSVTNLKVANNAIDLPQVSFLFIQPTSPGIQVTTFKGIWFDTDGTRILWWTGGAWEVLVAGLT